MGITVYRSDEQEASVASWMEVLLPEVQILAMIILQVMEKQLGKVKGRMDLQLKIIAELMQLRHQKSQNRLLQQMTSQEEMVWISATGSKYHSIPDCGNMNPDKAYQEPVSQAEAQGYEACKKCF